MAGQEHDGDTVELVTPDSAGGAARPAYRLAGNFSKLLSNLSTPRFGWRSDVKPPLNLTSTKPRATAAQQLRPAGKDEYEFTEEDEAPCRPRIAIASRPHAAPAAGRQHRVNAKGLTTPPSANTRYSRLDSEHERQSGVKACDTHLGHSVHIERDGQRTASTSGREDVTPVSHRVSAVPINGAANEVTRALEGLRTPKAPTDRMQVDSAGHPSRKVPAVPYTRAIRKAAKPSSPSCVELSSEEEGVYEDEEQHVHTKPASRPELRQSERSMKVVSGRNFYGNNASPVPVSSHQDQTPEPQESNRMAAPTVDIPERHPKKAKTMESPLAAMDLINWQPALLKSDVVFPTNEPDAVTVTNADMERLAPSEFLNDTLIDFYIKYLQTNLPDSQRARIHFFNSFFYKKLTQTDKAGQFGGAVGYARVRNWTRRVDIFTKDYIIVPINESLHWSVAVICHPGAASQAASSCTQGPRIPFIVHLDSMKGGHNKIDQYLCEYLAAAWEERAPQQPRTTNPFTKLPVLRPKVPQQDNYSDCGLFLLYYVERFCKDIVASNAAMVDQSAINSLLEASWFLPEEASAMRWELQHVLLWLDAQRHNAEPPSPPVIRQLLQEFKLQAAQEREAAASRVETAVDLVTPPSTAANDLACQDGFKNLSLDADEAVKTLPYGPSVSKQSPGTPPEEQEQHMELIHPLTNLTRELGEAEAEAEERPPPQLQQMRDRCIAAIRPPQSQVEKLQRLLPVKAAQKGNGLEQPGSSERLPDQQAPARLHADGSKAIVVNSDDEGSAVSIQRSYPLRSKGKLESMRRRQTPLQINF